MCASGHIDPNRIAAQPASARALGEAKRLIDADKAQSSQGKEPLKGSLKGKGKDKGSWKGSWKGKGKGKDKGKGSWKWGRVPQHVHVDKSWDVEESWDNW